MQKGLQEAQPAVLPGVRLVKNVPANAGGAKDAGLSLGSGRSPGGGNGNPLQYSCLGSPMDRGAWRAIVYGVTKSRTCLSDWACTYSPFCMLPDQAGWGFQGTFSQLTSVRSSRMGPLLLTNTSTRVWMK